MAFLNMLLSGVTNPRVLVSLLVAMLMVAFWVMGPSLLGLRGIWRVLVVVALGLILAVVQFLWSRRSQREKDRAALDLENSLIMEADATVADAAGDDKAAREEARRELVAAIDVIKNSRLADGTSSKAALYVLPWYLVLGTPGSGKSAVIRHSGLQRPGQGPGELRGIGASPHCEWWFTNHAVVLEADRRFAERSGVPGADGAWKAFLQTLGKQRPRTSINGVVVTVAADELLGCAAGDVEERARLLRQRLDAMMATLKQVFPVYLVVTKLDLVHGFGEYFAELPDAAAQQIFGATMRAPHMRSSQPERVFEHEFERLYTVLCRRRQRRLGQDDSPARRDGTYLFPLEFRALGDNLGRFVRLLFEDDVYGQSPLMRGFYFAATGGDGAAAEAVLARVDRELGLPQEGGGAPGALAGVRPHFLKDLFRRVVVPDRGIARPTRRVARRMRLVRRVLQTAVLGALGVLLVLLGVSFGRNLSLAGSTRKLAADARTVSVRVGGEAELKENLQRLEDLRVRLERLDRLDRRRPPTLGLGLYRGERINEAARAIYLDRFSVIVSDPARDYLARWLRGAHPAGDGYQQFEDRYRAFRMLVDPNHAEAPLLAQVLQDIWTEQATDGTPAERTLELLDLHTRYAVAHRDDLARFAAQRPRAREDLLRKCNGYIGDQWTTQAFYERKIAEINGRRQQDLGFSLARFGNASALLESGEESRADGTDVVPAAYTREGWWQEFRPFLAQSDSLVRNDWLLGEALDESNRNFRAELLAIYLEDYRARWNGFLHSVKVRTSGTVEAAVQNTYALRSRGSIYYDVLQQVTANVDPLGRERERDEATRAALEQLTEDFAALHTFWTKTRVGEDEVVPADLHRDGLAAIEGALTDLVAGDHRANAAAFTAEIFDAPGHDDAIGALIDFTRDHCLRPGGRGARSCSEALAAYLRQPALAAWRACLRETEEHLDTLWRDEVYRQYRNTIAGKFPVDARARAEVGLGEFGAFFGVEGTLHRFYQERLRPYLRNEEGDVREKYESALDLRPEARNLLAKALDIRQALFDASASEPGIRFTLLPRQMRSVGTQRAVIESSLFQLGTQRLPYDNGQGRRKSFTWPESADRLSAQIKVRTRDHGEFTDKWDEGPWALLRLIYAGRRERVPNTTNQYDIVWTLGEGGVRIELPYRLTVENRNYPLQDGWFELDCPERLHR